MALDTLSMIVEMLFDLWRQDPEGILGAPKSGHIARLEFKRSLEKDAEAREAFERQVREEKEHRRALREVGPWILSVIQSKFICEYLEKNLSTAFKQYSVIMLKWIEALII